MATRVRQQQHHHKARADGLEGAAPADRATSHGEDVKHDLDDLLDEIDEVLEENAEEFVKAYVQKGGQ